MVILKTKVKFRRVLPPTTKSSSKSQKAGPGFRAEQPPGVTVSAPGKEKMKVKLKAGTDRLEGRVLVRLQRWPES